VKREVEHIIKKGQVLATLIPAQATFENTFFVTEKAEPLQVGVSTRKKNDLVPAHYHVGTKRVITDLHEVVHVIKGEVLVSFFDLQGMFVAERTLKKGDTLLLKHGAHEFRYTKKTKLLLVKQGPYFSESKDKTFLAQPRKRVKR
jgi:hypothetical protein